MSGVKRLLQAMMEEKEKNRRSDMHYIKEDTRLINFPHEKEPNFKIVAAEKEVDGC